MQPKKSSRLSRFFRRQSRSIEDDGLQSSKTEFGSSPSQSTPESRTHIVVPGLVDEPKPLPLESVVREHESQSVPNNMQHDVEPELSNAIMDVPDEQPTPTGAICDSCNELIGTLVNMPTEFSRGQRIGTRKSQERGYLGSCRLCLKLDDKVTLEEATIYEQRVSLLNMETYSTNLRFRIRLSNISPETGATLTVRSETIVLLPRRTEAIRRRPGQVVNHGDHDDEDTPVVPQKLNLLLQAKAWYDTCLSTHKHCAEVAMSKSPSKVFMPKRLIQISRVNGGHFDIRLVETDGLGEPVRYATLSHRWPRDPMRITRLTTSNYPQFRKGFTVWPFRSSFPRVFTDAVKMCTTLGLEYLWMDSLCIIQSGDDLRDWEQEALKMANVYAYATVNFAQTDAGANGVGAQGLFESDWAVDRLAAKAPEYINVSRAYRKTYDVATVDEWMHNVEESALSRRGWVLQERHLSPRIIHFQSTQLYWECQSNICSEEYSNGLPEAVQRPAAHPILDPYARVVELYSFWYRSVADYSDCKITVASDRLVAIAGIAKRLDSRLNLAQDTYLAGHWKSDLICSLLWKVIVHKDRPLNMCKTLPPMPYRAPSWSWASVDSPVDTSLCMYTRAMAYRPLLAIQDAATTAEGDSFGRITGGVLVIDGHLLQVKVEIWGWPNIRLNFGGGLTPGSFAHSGTEEIQLVRFGEEDAPVDQAQLGEFRLLPICSVPGYLHCLIVQATGQPAEYRRVGIAAQVREETMQRVMRQLDEDEEAPQVIRLI